MTSGNSTKTPKISMFGTRKNATIPLRPANFCQPRRGASSICANQATGALTMAPALEALEGSLTVTADRQPLYRGSRYLRLSVLVDPRIGLFERQLAGHHLADARHQGTVIDRAPLPGRQGAGVR